MARTLVQQSVLVVLLLFGSLAASNSTIEWIYFDDYPDGTSIEDQYAAKGVRFVNDYPGYGSTYRSKPTIVQTGAAWSGPNVLVNKAASELFTSANVPLVIRFDGEVAGVGLRLGLAPGEAVVPMATVSLYDCNGLLRARETAVPSANFSTALEVWDSPTAGHSRLLVIDYGATVSPEAIDDLAYQSGTGTCSDTTPPVVQITSHEDKQVVASSPIVLQGTVQDNSGCIQQFRINGQDVPLTPHVSPGGQPAYTFFHTKSLNPGSTQISAMAWDAAGKTGKDVILIHYGPPSTVQLNEFHLTQRGIMRQGACDLDEPFVAGKFAIVKIKLEARTAGGALTYIDQVQMSLFRKVGTTDQLVHTYWGTTYSPFVSIFDSTSQMAGIHFWIPGEDTAVAGEYRMTFQAYLGDTPIGALLQPCSSAYFQFSQTQPMRLFFCPTEAPMYAPDLGSKYYTQTLTALDYFNRVYPIADNGLECVVGAPLPIADGSAQMMNAHKYIEGTGFEWTFKDTHPSGLWRASHTIVRDGTTPIGGVITSGTLVNLPAVSPYGYFRPGGPPQWKEKRYVVPMDDDHDGTIDDDMAHYIGQFYDNQTGAWSTNLQNYEMGETFRGFQDQNGNHQHDPGEPESPSVRRWRNMRDKLLLGPSLQRMNDYNDSLLSGPKMEHAVLWFPEPFHPDNEAFAMLGNGQGSGGEGKSGKDVWVRIPPVWERVDDMQDGEYPNGAASTLAHEIGHNLGLGDTYYSDTPASKYIINASAAYNYYKTVPAARLGELRGIMRGGNFLSRLYFTDAHYLHLFNKLKVSASKPSLSGSELAQEPAFRVSGTLHPDEGLLSLDTRIISAAEFTPPDEASPYRVVLGAEGEVLLEFRLPVHYRTVMDAYSDGALDPGQEDWDDPVGSFDAVVPLPEGTGWVEILREGEVLARVERSANVPAVVVQYPNGGESFGAYEEVEITWSSRDGDGDPLEYAVLYSPDYGTRWQVLASGLTATSFLWNTGSSPGGNEAIIRVRACDGFHTGHDDSNAPFSVQGKPPVAAIIEPATMSVFLEGEHIPLRGVAYDPEGGSLSVFWDVYGDAGGTDFYALSGFIAPLPPGEYIAELSVIDSSSLSAVQQSLFTVRADSDRDGIPDDLEEEWGLDPSNPGDALWDLDEDGLNSFEESRHGTDPNNWDSDGDGWSDGDEVEAGTDPLNPNDYPGAAPTATPTPQVRPTSTPTQPNCVEAGMVFADAVTGLQEVDLGAVKFTGGQSPVGAPVTLDVLDCSGDGALDIFIPWSQATGGQNAEMVFSPNVCAGSAPVGVEFALKLGTACTFYTLDEAGATIEAVTIESTAEPVVLSFSHPAGIRTIVFEGAEICIMQVCWACQEVELTPTPTGTVTMTPTPSPPETPSPTPSATPVVTPPPGGCAKATDVFSSPVSDLPEVDLGPVKITQAWLPDESPVPLDVTDCSGDEALDVFIPWSEGSALQPATIEFAAWVCERQAPKIVEVTLQHGYACILRAFDETGNLVDAATATPVMEPQLLLLSSEAGIRRLEVEGAEICILEICWLCGGEAPTRTPTPTPTFPLRPTNTATPTESPLPPTKTPTPVAPTVTPTPTETDTSGFTVLPLWPIVLPPYEFEPLVAQDLSIHGIEVTQAIQYFDTSQGLSNADNSLPLVLGKSTVARIYLNYTNSVHFITQRDDVPVRLYIRPVGGLWQSSLVSAVAKGSINQSAADQSANVFFVVLSSANSRAVEMYAEVDPGSSIPEINETNNRYPASGYLTLTFHKREGLKITGQRLDYHPPGYTGTRLAGGWAVNGGGAAWFNQILPLANGGIDYSLASGYLDWTTSLATSDGQHALIEYMNSLWGLANLLSILFTGETTGVDHYYGWAPDSGYSGGHADMPMYPHAGGLGVVAIGTDAPGTSTDNPGRGAVVFGHELCHDHNLQHTDTGSDDCGANDPSSDFPYATSSIQEFGFNTTTKRIYNPSNTHDLMSYCPPGSREGWISPFHWNKMFNSLALSKIASKPLAEGQTPLPQVFYQTGGETSLMVSATLFNPAESGGIYQGELGPLYRVDTGSQYVLPEGDYALELRNGDTVLSRRDFAVSFKNDWESEGEYQPEFSRADVTFIIPWEAATDSVVLLHSDEVLDQRPVSDHAPVVTITSPAQAVDWPAGSNQTLAWDATDLDGDPLSFSVLYSYDGGFRWQMLASQLEEPFYELAVDTLAGSTHARFRVVATDGVNIGFDETDERIGVPNKVPQVIIMTPQSGSRYAPGGLVILQGLATDLEDGSLPDEALEWSSDLQGSLGTGSLLPLNTLEVGQHTITLSATDGDLQSAGATVVITINDPALLQFDLNRDGFIGRGDLLEILARWKQSVSQGYPPSKADLNADGEVNMADLFEFQRYWQPSQP